MNRMEEVAALFNKKLGEEFVVNDECKSRVKFTNDGLSYACPINREFDNDLLVQMLRGFVEIVEDKT